MSKRLLLAEGNPSTADEYVVQLARNEFIVDVVYDGNSALEYLRTQAGPLDCILLDANLPGKNGFTVFEEIGAEMGSKKTPVIILSDSGEQRDFERCDSLGAASCIVKMRSTSDDIVKEVVHVIEGRAHPLEVGSVPSDIDVSSGDVVAGEMGQEQRKNEVDPLIES